MFLGSVFIEILSYGQIISLSWLPNQENQVYLFNSSPGHKFLKSILFLTKFVVLKKNQKRDLSL